MPRVPRKYVVNSKGGFFHVLNRISGYIGEYPLQTAQVSSEFISRLKYALGRSCIHCAEFTLMGNHFHLILFVEEFRKLSRCKLERFAKARWGQLWKLRTRFWSDKGWEKFNEELFDLSGFMRDLQGPFSTWFNKTFARRGRLWSDRFKCLALDKDLTAVWEEMLYVALNPVRAGLTDLPEEWKGGSIYLRSIGEADFLMSLAAIYPDLARAEVEPFYRHMLLYRGMTPRRENQASIPAEIVAAELERGFAPGLFLKRCRFMIDGLMLGNQPAVMRKLDELIEAGIYKRRCNPIQHLKGLFYTAREQRSHSQW